MNLVHFSQTNWVWFSFLNLKSKMKIKGLLNVIPGIFNHVHMLLFIFFNSPFLDCKGITQPFQHMTYGLWFFFFFFWSNFLKHCKKWVKAFLKPNVFFRKFRIIQFGSFLLAKYVCRYHFLSYSGNCNVQCRLMEPLIFGGYTETKLTLCLVFELFCR